MPTARGPCPAPPGRWLVLVALPVVALALAARPTAAWSEGEAGGGCPNSQLRAEDGSLALPDCRAYELVSPADRDGGQIAAPGMLWGGGLLEAAASGEAATFSSEAAFGDDAVGAPPASQYVSRRTAAGWTTQDITPPTASGAYGDHPDGVPYQLFSPDLSRALMLDGRRCGEAEECPRSYSLREGRGGLLADSPAQPSLRLEGASPDLGRIVFSDAGGLYGWSGGGLEAISETPGAGLAAQAGAVSEDGSRAYFGEGGDLYLREGATTRPVPEATGGASFQTASADGAIAFFTAGNALYRYSATAGSSSQIATGVKGVLGASEDGSVVYYQDAGGLHRWDEGAVATIAAGAEATQESDWPPTTGTARVTPDGQALAFLSSESLTGYDNDDAATGEPDSEVFLWSAGAGLACISCNPGGRRPEGPSTIPGAIAGGTGEGGPDSYKPRALSSDGRRLFFGSADQILTTDVSAASDVYEWEAPGEGSCAAADCLFLISSGDSAEPSTLVDASESGSNVFFLTGDSLVPTDPGSADLYDAREGGGFPVPAPPTPCDGDACQSIPSPPEDPTPATLVPSAGNPPLSFPKEKPVRCKGGFAKKKGKCVRKSRRRGKKSSKRSHRRAHHNRGGRR